MKSMTPDDPDEDTAPNGETIARDAFQPGGEKDETGDLAKLSLEEILTNIFCARSTGTLTVEAAGGELAGEVVVWKGDVLAATTGKKSGLALLERTAGAFRFTEELEPREQNVRRSVPDLVAEAARRRGDKRPRKP
jgi:Domain of unknown function (DUF4388)